MLVNVVYAKLDREIADVDALPGTPIRFTWSRAELTRADAVVYFNAYSYNARAADKAGKKPRILYAAEPVAVYPPQYRRDCWRQFDTVLTFNPLLAKESNRFRHVPVTSYGYPFENGHGLTAPAPAPDALRRRPLAVCQIAGAKFSLLSCGRYGARKRIARWFHDHSGIPFDVYGHPPMAVPNYRGIAVDKLSTLRRYRFALCFENSFDARWTCGYLTEKLFDCLHAGTVPIYLGCPDIERYVPPDCYIDYRQFPGPAELERYLLTVSLEDTLTMAFRGREFLDAHRPAERYHCDALYRSIADVLACRPGAGDTAPEDPWPPDFPAASPGWRDRVAFEVSCAVLRSNRLFGAAAGFVRAVQSGYSGARVALRGPLP